MAQKNIDGNHFSWKCRVSRRENGTCYSAAHGDSSHSLSSRTAPISVNLQEPWRFFTWGSAWWQWQKVTDLFRACSPLRSHENPWWYCIAKAALVLSAEFNSVVVGWLGWYRYLLFDISLSLVWFWYEWALVADFFWRSIKVYHLDFCSAAHCFRWQRFCHHCKRGEKKFCREFHSSIFAGLPNRILYMNTMAVNKYIILYFKEVMQVLTLSFLLFYSRRISTAKPSILVGTSDQQ